MYRLSYLRSIEPCEARDAPHSSMSRPYHEMINACINSDLCSLKTIVEQLVVDDFDNIIKNDNEVYKIVCQQADFDLIEYLTEYMTANIKRTSNGDYIANLLASIIGHKRPNSLRIIQYLYGHFQNILTRDVFMKSLCIGNISLEELQWLLSNMSQFRLTFEHIRELFYNHNHEVLTFLLDNISLIQDTTEQLDNLLCAFFLGYCYSYDISKAQSIYEKISNIECIDEVLTNERFYDILKPGYYMSDYGVDISDVSVDTRIELIRYLQSIKPSLDIRNEKLFRLVIPRHIGDDKLVETFCRMVPEFRTLDCYQVYLSGV